MDADVSEAEGACHRGGVRFHVRLAEGLRNPRRCTCSFCRMRGAVVVSALADALEVRSGEDLLTRYRFNTGTAEHFFCSRCGIYTHHRRRSDPGQMSVNVACLEGVSPFDFEAVPVTDGINHPSDGHSQGVIGILRIERTASAKPGD